MCTSIFEVSKTNSDTNEVCHSYKRVLKHRAVDIRFTSDNSASIAFISIRIIVYICKMENITRPTILIGM